MEFFTINSTIIADVKAALRRALPSMKSSHRVEALARGLSWSTYAALRAKISTITCECKINQNSFSEYLAEHGIYSQITLSNILVEINSTSLRKVDFLEEVCFDSDEYYLEQELSASYREVIGANAEAELFRQKLREIMSASHPELVDFTTNEDFYLAKLRQLSADNKQLENKNRQLEVGLEMSRSESSWHCQSVNALKQLIWNLRQVSPEFAEIHNHAQIESSQAMMEQIRMRRVLEAELDTLRRDAVKALILERASKV